MKKVIFITAISLIMTGCSINKQSMGLGRQSPDEFMVMKRSPLTLPPEYNLVPPGSKVSISKEINPEEEAQKAILGAPIKTEEIKNEDYDFLKSINATKVNPKIRETVNEESENDPTQNKYLINSLMFGSKKDNSVIVNNVKEAKRIKENKEQNLNINEGEVIVIDPIQ